MKLNLINNESLYRDLVNVDLGMGNYLIVIIAFILLVVLYQMMKVGKVKTSVYMIGVVALLLIMLYGILSVIL